jgi:hypothetical protein
LWIARIGVLALMYIFLLVLVIALIKDARAVSTPAQIMPAPQPAPRPAAKPVTATATAPASTATAVATGVTALEVVAGTMPTTGREYLLYGMLERWMQTEKGEVL